MAFENISEAEKLFESVLNDALLEKVNHVALWVISEKKDCIYLYLKIEYSAEGSDEKELVQLKYAILKNLALISREKTHDYSKALDCIIKVSLRKINDWALAKMLLKIVYERQPKLTPRTHAYGLTWVTAQCV